MKRSSMTLLALISTTLVALPAFGGDFPLIFQGSTWSFLDDGSDQGTAWRGAAFDDTSWQQGAAQLGYGDGDEVSTVRCRQSMPTGTACAAGGPADKIITTYFRRAFQVRDPGSISGLKIRLQVDDGAVIYLNGEEIERVNMPAGEIAFDTLAAGAATNENGFANHNAPANALVVGRNVLAVEVHQHSQDSSDVSFDLRLRGTDPDLPDLIRGPYLQNGTPSSAVVHWRTETAVPSRVELAATPDGAAPTVFSDAAPKTEHAVEIDLSALPDRQGYYAVGTDDGMLADFDPEQVVLRPLAAGADSPLRVWVIGDSGTADDNAVAVRDGFRRHDAEQESALWLMLGDNAYPNGSDGQYQDAVFDLYPMLLNRLILWSTPGNHDVNNADSPSQSGPYYDIFNLPKSGEAGGMPSGTEAYYSFDYGKVHFVSLDSADTDLSPNAAMMAWLIADLNSTAQEWIVAFWHHPPYSKGSHDSDSSGDSGGRLFAMREDFLPVLEAAGVDLVLTGHSHSYERTFMLSGHYDTSDTLTPGMIVDSGDGDPEGDGAYFKDTSGTLYAVAGSSGRISGGALNHPAMLISLNELGSMILDFDGPRLDGQFIDDGGEIRDVFTLVKEPRPQLAATATPTREGRTASLPLSLDRIPRVDVVIDYATSNQSAAAGEDYVAQSGTVTIPAGQSSATIDIATLTDGVNEGDETFTVSFSNVKNATLTSAAVTVTVQDIDHGDCVDCGAIVCLPSADPGLVGSHRGAMTPSKADRPAMALTVPSYAVDTGSTTGVTTLYALRNLNPTTTELTITYQDKLGTLLRQEPRSLLPEETLTLNLRDVAGLSPGPDGFKRGLIHINATQDLTGDFFQVDVDNDFATGERLIQATDLCTTGETRFLDFGSGTQLALLIADPNGGDPTANTPSFSVRIVDEAGATDGVLDCYTDQQLLELDASLFTSLPFGTLAFDFTDGEEGYVYAAYSADGQFSVGLGWDCDTPPSAAPSPSAPVDLPVGSLSTADETLFVPFFTVDASNPGGTTTLFAVRNKTTTPLELLMDYLTIGGGLMAQEEIIIPAQATRSRNLRDVQDLVVGEDGFAHGFVRVRVVGPAPPSGAAQLAGDFFQVDVGNAFATGDRMIREDDLCSTGEVRFLDFGSGTRLRILLEEPQGTDNGSNPPSFTVSARGEDGAAFATQSYFADQNVVDLTAADFSTLSFGSLVFDFSASGGGFVYAEYSADGKFSVGLNFTCRD